MKNVNSLEVHLQVDLAFKLAWTHLTIEGFFDMHQLVLIQRGYAGEREPATFAHAPLCLEMAQGVCL